MNGFVIMTPSAGNQNRHIAVVEYKGDSPPRRLSMRDKKLLVLKVWRDKFIGTTPRSNGYLPLKQANEILAVLQASGIESARPLYVLGVFDKPHDELMSILGKLKECDCEQSD